MTISDTSTPARPLLVLGAGSQPYRSYFLEGLAARHPLVLADSEPPSWSSSLVHGHLPLDLADPEAALAAVKSFADRVPVGGVCTYMEHHVELMAQIAELLGLPGPSPAAMGACRDKAATRRLLAEHHVLSALSVQAGTEDEAVDGARAIGYPVVVKPRAMAGSAGVLRADTDAEVRAAFLHASQETVLGLDAYAVGGVLVEEYLDGEEISAETVVVGGDVQIVAVTRKRLGNEPRFQEIGHVVDAADPLLTDPAVTATVTGAVRALGIQRGVLHIELRLTAHGPAVIEANGRPAGDLIPLLVLLATGVDLPAVVADLARGVIPDLTPTRSRAAGVRFLLPAFSGRLGAVQVARGLRETPWLERLVWTRHMGERVTAPPLASIDDRIGHWVVTADNADQCHQRLTEVLVQISAPTSGDSTHTTACVR
ncbi:ATP-grasp domain-containing protein [Streptomyces sp. NPDC090080]|uniref:ATP-grasp domain-containing protein n=1 Tax=Streptomyces sp. NPDC090080 TaxID=3365939 RepID=UPI00382DE327